MRPTTVEEARIIRASINNSVARALVVSRTWYDAYLDCLKFYRPFSRALYYRTKAVVTFDRELV